MPSSQRLISLFLEGLKNKSLHANLYGKKHDTLNECIKDAIDFDNNCEIYGNVDKKIHSPSETSSVKSGKTQETSPVEADAIADLVVKKMNQVFKPQPRPQEYQRFQKPYMCGNCAGDHPTSQCMLKPQNPVQHQPRLDKWCDFEQKWTSHDTKDCWHRIRFMREQGMAPMPNPGNPRVFNNPNIPMGGDKAMPVLGQQPPLPGNAAVRLVHTEEENNEQALVPSYPYYEESPEERQQDTYQSLPTCLL